MEMDLALSLLGAQAIRLALAVFLLTPVVVVALQDDRPLSPSWSPSEGF